MSDDEYEIPLQDQRVFGAGLKRKRVQFVPSSTSNTTSPPVDTSTSSTSVADRYLNLVLPKPNTVRTNKETSTDQLSKTNNDSINEPSSVQTCEVCSLPLAPSSSPTTIPRPHEATLAHQVCLTHSHPPSHFDRSRLGLRLLQSRGWDPDSRRGLGVHGQGIQFPIKARAKDDKLGLGVVIPEGMGKIRRKNVEKLDAGKVRKLEDRDRRKRENLQDMFYRSADVERYLRGR